MAVATGDLVRVVNGNLVPIPGVWEFDQGHTEVGFEGTHLVVNRIRGRFLGFSGRLIVAEDPARSVAELTVDASSVDSGSKVRDDHLKSADWFDVKNHPLITFRSGGLNHVTGNRWSAEGLLTVKRIVQPVELTVDFGGAVNDPWGASKVGAAVTAEVDRHDWDLTWNVPLDAGGFVVGRTIKLIVNVEASLQRSTD